MKRSKTIQLVLLGTCALAISSCDDKKNVSFKDEKECLQHHTAEECKKAMEDSKKQYAEKAPKFMSKEECEKQYGAAKCVQAEGHHAEGHSMFMPMMMGFMMGRMFGGGHSFALPQANPMSQATPAPKAAPQRGGFGSKSSHYSSSGS
jgi:uncharacterized protein YgiB involved in biofilm formation